MQQYNVPFRDFQFCYVQLLSGSKVSIRTFLILKYSNRGLSVIGLKSRVASPSSLFRQSNGFPFGIRNKIANFGSIFLNGTLS